MLTTTTGGAAAYGESIKAGAEIGSKRKSTLMQNAVKINLLVEDTKGDKNEAINAMNKVISKDKSCSCYWPNVIWRNDGSRSCSKQKQNRSSLAHLQLLKVLQISAITFSVTLYQNPWQ